jgi:hypothetical protein
MFIDYMFYLISDMKDKEFLSLKYFSEPSDKTIFNLFNFEIRVCEANNNEKQNFKIFIQKGMKK